MGIGNLFLLLHFFSHVHIVRVTVSWSCVLSLQEKLGTVTSRFIYRQIYQHLFLIGCCDGQVIIKWFCYVVVYSIITTQ